MTAPTGLLGRATVRAGRVCWFLLYFGYEFLYSNLTVLWEIIWPGRAAPAVLRVPLRSRTRREIVSISNLITLTPGTLTVETAIDPPTLWVHVMFARDPAASVAQIHRLEATMLAAMRPAAAGAGADTPATGPSADGRGERP